MLNVFVLFASALATFLTLEISARVFLEYVAPEQTFVNYASFRQLQARYGDPESGATGALRQLYSPHRYLGYYPTPGYERGKNRHGSRGFRGDEIEMPKPASMFRIACVGGSTTYDSDIEDHRLTYPAQLEAVLKERGFESVEVVNAGAAGWTTWEVLVNFEFRVLDLEPDLVVFYEAINDVHPRFVWTPERYAGDNSGYRAANQSGLFMPSILEYSTLLRIFMIRAGWTTSHADISRTIDRLAATYYGDLWRDQHRRGEYPRGIFEQTSGAQMLEANPPRYFERNVASLVSVARANRVPVVLATFAYSPDFAEEPRVTAPEYQRAIREHNETLQRVAREQGASLFDFAAVFPTDRRYFTDGRHNNESGARRKAELFADYLAGSGLVR